MHCKVPPVVPYKTLENFSKALYGTTGGTYSAQVFRPVMKHCSIHETMQIVTSFVYYCNLHVAMTSFLSGRILTKLTDYNLLTS